MILNIKTCFGLRAIVIRLSRSIYSRAFHFCLGSRSNDNFTTDKMSGDKKPKEWSDYQRSKIHLLYKDLESIGKKDVQVELCGKTYKAKDLLLVVLNSLTFISKRMIQPTIRLDSITKDQVKNLNTFLDTMQKCTTVNVTAQFYKLIDFGPKVKFWHTEFKKGVFYPARMLIDLKNEEINEGESVMINTGYVIRMPMLGNMRNIDRTTKTVTINKDIVKQPDFIIVPLIVCDENSHIIPSIYARDQDDTGLFTVNFTLVKGKLERLQIVFNAYLTDRPNTAVSLIDSIPNQVIFKPKDSKNGRSVKNPKVKVHYDRMEIDDTKNYIYFPTYNVTVKPIVTYPDQKLQICNQYVLFSSRRREWFNPELVTLAGMYLKKDKYIKPIVLKTEEQTTNTHCISFLKSKVVMFSESPDNWLHQEFKIINGSFRYIENFEEHAKLLKQLSTCANGLALGYNMVKNVKNNVPTDHLLKIYDYHRQLTLNSIDSLASLSDEELFNKKIGNSSAFSVVLYKAILKLLLAYKSDELSEEQKEKIQNDLRIDGRSAAAATTTTTTVMSTTATTTHSKDGGKKEEDGNDDVIIEAKRAKLE
jgi:nitrate reductase assembly molybdenum cofactor insertion protein NarJ